MGEQLKKLIYTKHITDEGVKWKFSVPKFSILILFALIVLTLIYGMMQPDTQKFFGDLVVYGLIGLAIFWVLLLVYHMARKSSKWIKGYFIAFILLIFAYAVLAIIAPYISNALDSQPPLKVNAFHFGLSTWLLLALLSSIHQVDGKLDRKDVLVAMFAIGAIIGTNLAIFSGDSLLEKFDRIPNLIIDLIGRGRKWF